MFELIKTDDSSKARRGRITTRRGEVDTPVFMSCSSLLCKGKEVMQLLPWCSQKGTYRTRKADVWNCSSTGLIETLSPKVGQLLPTKTTPIVSRLFDPSINGSMLQLCSASHVNSATNRRLLQCTEGTMTTGRSWLSEWLLLPYASIAANLYILRQQVAPSLAVPLTANGVNLSNSPVRCRVSRT